MAFLWSFIGLLVAGFIWMAIFVSLLESSDPSLQSLAEWLSPMSVSGWIAYVVLAVLCCLLARRLLRGAPR